MKVKFVDTISSEICSHFTKKRKLLVINCFIFCDFLFPMEQNYVSHVKVLLYAQI